MIIALTVVYTALAAGIHLHMHYCCGKLTDVHFSGGLQRFCDTQHEGATPCCSMDGKCCSSIELNFAIDDEHSCPASFKFLTFPIVETVTHHSHFPFDEYSGISPLVSDSGPPIIEKRFLRFASLVFYA